MKQILSTLLLVGYSIVSYGQDDLIGEEVQEYLAVYGYCIMPNNSSMLTLEADYDGMYIRERELIDFFETGQFEYSKDLTDWIYYNYWVLNERTLEQPEDHTFYQMVVDPTGTYVAIAEEVKDGWSTTFKIFNKGTQTLVTTFDCRSVIQNLDYLNMVRFNGQGNQLIIGAKNQGIYSYTIDSKEFKKLYSPNTYYLQDYSYVSDTPILKAYVKTSDGDYVLDPDMFTLKGGTKEPVSLPLPLHYTRILSPTETHKYYGAFYEQDYDTYLAPIDDFNYQIIYRNKEIFKFRTREVPKE